MKNIIVFLSLLLFVFSACNEAAKQPNNTTPTMPSGEVSATTNDALPEFDKIMDDLSGSWKRVDYPYDVVTFKNSEMKYTEGEGSADEPKFEEYKLSNNCSLSKTAEYDEKNLFVVRPDGVCDRISLSDDNLIFSDEKKSYKIRFKKVEI